MPVVCHKMQGVELLVVKAVRLQANSKEAKKMEGEKEK